jgi:hypothetical protein
VRIDGAVPLADTLTLPDGPGPVRAGAIASGPGPLDRDANHRRARFDVARQPAHAPAEAGLVSLRYDKRGVGTSSGDWRAADLYDNVATSGRDVLRARPEVDPARVLVAGHSEGPTLSAAPAARGARINARWTREFRPRPHPRCGARQACRPCGPTAGSSASRWTRRHSGGHRLVPPGHPAPRAVRDTVGQRKQPGPFPPVSAPCTIVVPVGRPEQEVSCPS